MQHRMLVAHHSFHHGGETHLVNNVIRALCETGFEVPLIVTATKPSREATRFLRGTCVGGVSYMIPVATKTFFFYQRLLLRWGLKRILGAGTPPADLVFIDNPFYKNLGKTVAGIVEYVHFPLETLLPENYKMLPPEARREIEPYFRKYRKSRIGRIYLGAFTRLAKRYMRGDPHSEASLLLANSTWTNRLLEMLYGRGGIVLHPPIDYGYISRFRSRSRERYVVSIGRISPEKRFEDIIKAVSLIEGERPGVRIIGSYARSNRWYLEKLLRTAKKYNVDLDVKLNPSYDQLLKLVGRSLVYVHSAIGEHFGITILEAMALGLPVVVHRSGGAYHDIIDRDVYGLSYETLGELASNLRVLLEDEEAYKRYSTLSISRAREYDYRVFRERLAGLLEGL
ncbi:MAG: glycosyltransferase [Desulfurococcales archaeon]|nr:glycosyltransferase [Desulfurococcales archaeon]